MDTSQWNRILRMRDQRFYLVSMTGSDKCRNFILTGSTGNLYTVVVNLSESYMSKFITCDCPDGLGTALDTDIRCKHACFVWIKILKQDVKKISSWKITPTIRQQIDLQCSKITQNVVAEFTNTEYQTAYALINTDYSVKRASQEWSGNECPICFESLASILPDMTLGVECYKCHNVLHAVCMNKWLTGNRSCVFCRTPWQPEFSNTTRYHKYINLKNCYKKCIGSDDDDE